MIWHIACKEFTEISRDGRFLWTCLIVAALLLLSLALGASRFADESALRASAELEVRQQWLDQGPKGPHSASHYGVYAFKPATPLALFDPGMNDYTGILTMLEAHKENQSSYKPAQDATALQRFGDLSGAMILQVLVPLLIILLCFGMISGEREEGTLRQLLSIGADQRDLVWGKGLAVAMVLGLLLLPAAAVGGLIAATQMKTVDPHDLVGLPAKVLVLVTVYLVYFGIFAVVSLSASIAMRSSSAALTLLIAFWIINGLMLPRAAADVSRLAYPTPSALELSIVVERDKAKGPHPHEVNHPNHIAFRDQMLKKYGVSRVEDLPYSFIGLALQADEEHGFKVFDRHYGFLREAHDRQNRLQQLVSLIAPSIAIRSVSAALSGTDIDFFQDFSAAGEVYRRNLVRVMNDNLMREAAGQSNYAAEWQYKANKDLWAKIPPFDFDAPGLSKILERNLVPLGALALWMIVGVAMLRKFARRLQVDRQ